MSMNKGKAKASPARKVAKSKSTASTAGIPKRGVMNRRKYNEAISGDTTSGYAMYKKGGKIKKYQPGGVTDYVKKIMKRMINDDSVVGNNIIKPTLRAALTHGPSIVNAVMGAGSKMEKGPKQKKGGTTKTKKFAALAPPYDKVTFADKIAGAKKRSKKK